MSDYELDPDYRAVIAVGCFAILFVVGFLASIGVIR